MPDARKGAFITNIDGTITGNRSLATSAPRRRIVIPAPRAVRLRSLRADCYLNRELSWLEFERRVSGSPPIPAYRCWSA